MILSGDLGKFGSEILIELMQDQGFDISGIHDDCGKMLFNEKQKTLMGGSGCGCSASVLNSVILKRFKDKIYKKIIFIATGALP